MEELRACGRGFRIAATSLTDALGVQLVCIAAMGIGLSIFI